MLTKTCFVVVAVLVVAASANAGPTYLNLVLDPPTTAGFGIPPIPAPILGGGSFTVTSTQSGPLTYHLYALDDNTGSQGIANYSIAINGATSSLHRSPVTGWVDGDEIFFNAGFGLLRSANNLPPGGVFQASQPLPGSDPVLITGFGQTTSNFVAKIPAAIVFVGTVSGQWGNYATAPSAGTTGKNWVLIGEGAYAAGSPPAISSSVVGFYDSNGVHQISQIVIGTPEPVGVSPIVNNGTIPDVFSEGGPVQHQFATSAGDEPITWGNLQFVSYTPNYGGAGPYTPGSFSLTNEGLFTWNPTGAHRGDYVWSVDATNAAGAGSGTLTVNVTSVPEPASLGLLLSLAPAALLRRRHPTC